MPTLSIRCKPQILVPPSDPAPYVGEVDGLLVREILEPIDPVDCPSARAVRYSIAVETEVHTTEGVSDARRRADTLIEDLERIWPYSAGLPIRPVRTYLEVQYAPEGWTSNAKDVEKQTRSSQSGLTAEVTVRSRHWVQAPYLPLKRALQSLDPFRAAPSVVQTLIDLHFSALSSTGKQGGLFFLARALELARALLPGSNLRAKSGSLHREVQDRLTRPLDWIYNMSNNRFDVRHVVRKPEGPHLHPQMNAVELQDFEYNADLVIRGLVAQRLGIELVIVAKSPTASG